MIVSKSEFISELQQYTQSHILAVQKLETASDEALQARPQLNAWNALECIEHLNQYGRYYIPEMSTAIANYKGKASDEFKPGLLGNYFAQMMLPSHTKKIKSMKSYNPIGKQLGREVLVEFLRQQQELLVILQKCEQVNLTKVKCNISLTKLLKLRLGDTLRVVIYHNARHMLQAQKALEG
ncbi:DinB family protein [Gynurincola endophyticus]|uniref:DinB family protein n=1 Tax=Gynurincola endophyticus TaxID=2479004 RepID=UPI000F8D5062|nr:DinB family protein [Gynurincola endophyticus]